MRIFITSGDWMPLERATQIQYRKTIINKVPNKIK